MKYSDELKIKEEANAYHDNILDLWGREFNFSHEKGLAEWLKNSIDAYLRLRLPDKDQYIIFRFSDGTAGKPPEIECIDFAGMTHADIDKAFKWWGDPDAAKRGLRIRTYGGHGNGGKFYMRQMFNTSRFITYRDGKLNIFGFSKNKKYGFVIGFENEAVRIEDALNIANLDGSIIPEKILRILKSGKTGFTVVRGIRPLKIVGNRLPVSLLCERLKYHPQARRPLKSCNVSVVYNGKVIADNLRMEEIEPMKGFEEPMVFEIPEHLESKSGQAKRVEMANRKYQKGWLVLRTSSIPFGHGGKKSELNCIDIIGEIGIIASYKMTEIGPLRYFPQAQSIYGECSCPILEDPDEDCVLNDRERLVDNPRTLVLREWIAAKIDEFGAKIAEKEQKEEEKKNFQKTDEFNQILNKWKDQFMSRLFAEVLGGLGKGGSFGGTGTDGTGTNGLQGLDHKGGTGTGKGGGEGEERRKGTIVPRVLLSEQNDPDFPGIFVTFSERHFPVEQRQQDLERGIYWINMNKPMARKIIEKYGVNSLQWRNYLFQRYVDIFVKETIYREAKKEGGSLTPEVIDERIMKVASAVYDKAIIDLESFLLEEKYDQKITGEKQK